MGSQKGKKRVSKRIDLTFNETLKLMKIINVIENELWKLQGKKEKTLAELQSLTSMQKYDQKNVEKLENMLDILGYKIEGLNIARAVLWEIYERNKKRNGIGKPAVSVDH